MRLIGITFESVLRFYRRERGTGKDAIEVSPFFKRADVYQRFQAFWPTQGNATLRTRYERARDRFRAALASAE